MVACNLERARVLRANQVGLERRRLEIRCVGKEDAMGNQDSTKGKVLWAEVRHECTNRWSNKAHWGRAENPALVESLWQKKVQPTPQ